MRTSVEFGLAYIRDHFQPRPDDVWLLSPADHPVLDPSIVPVLVSEWIARQPRILVPTHHGQRGHPTLFRWDLADEVPRLPAHVGLNHLLRTHAADVLELPVESPGILFDLDTPDDFAVLASRFRESNTPGA
jgi:molybdenum cofactor cytidylyltransferase